MFNPNKFLVSDRTSDAHIEATLKWLARTAVSGNLRLRYKGRYGEKGFINPDIVLNQLSQGKGLETIPTYNFVGATSADKIQRPFTVILDHEQPTYKERLQEIREKEEQTGDSEAAQKQIAQLCVDRIKGNGRV